GPNRTRSPTGTTPKSPRKRARRGRPDKGSAPPGASSRITKPSQPCRTPSFHVPGTVCRL
ncbi:MAG: hypothetical protein AVDCRST_MAG08-3705, partial [uncultured Acetobacteraceae bacterium]